MALHGRILRLERQMVTDATGAFLARKCPTCRDGANRRQVTCLDGVPTWASDGGSLDVHCPACGREVADLANVIGVDPARL